MSSRTVMVPLLYATMSPDTAALLELSRPKLIVLHPDRVTEITEHALDAGREFNHVAPVQVLSRHTHPNDCLR